MQNVGKSLQKSEIREKFEELLKIHEILQTKILETFGQRGKSFGAKKEEENLCKMLENVCKIQIYLQSSKV